MQTQLIIYGVNIQKTPIKILIIIIKFIKLSLCHDLASPLDHDGPYQFLNVPLRPPTARGSNDLIQRGHPGASGRHQSLGSLASRRQCPKRDEGRGLSRAGEGEGHRDVEGMMS